VGTAGAAQAQEAVRQDAALEKGLELGMGFPNEAYVFAAFVYFVLCFGMSKYSQRLERVLSPETRR